MLGIAIDLFLLGRLILNNPMLSAALAIGMFLLFCGLWYLFPWTFYLIHIRRRRVALKH
jgi:hypothetical protein